MTTERDPRLDGEQQRPEQINMPDPDVASNQVEAQLTRPTGQKQNLKSALTSLTVLLALLPSAAFAAWLLKVLGDFLGMVDHYYPESINYWNYYAIGVGFATLLPAALVAVSDRAFFPATRLFEAGRVALLSFSNYAILFLLIFGGLNWQGWALPLFAAPLLLAGFTPLLCFIALSLGHYWASQIFCLPVQNTRPPRTIRLFTLLGLGSLVATVILMLYYGRTLEMNTSAAWTAVNHAAQALTLACLIWLLAYRGQAAWRLGFLLLVCWMVFSDASTYALWPLRPAVLRATRDLGLITALLCLYLPASRRWLLA